MSKKPKILETDYERFADPKEGLLPYLAKCVRELISQENDEALQALVEANAFVADALYDLNEEIVDIRVKYEKMRSKREAIMLALEERKKALEIVESEMAADFGIGVLSDEQMMEELASLDEIADEAAFDVAMNMAIGAISDADDAEETEDDGEPEEEVEGSTIEYVSKPGSEGNIAEAAKKGGMFAELMTDEMIDAMKDAGNENGDASGDVDDPLAGLDMLTLDSVLAAKDDGDEEPSENSENEEAAKSAAEEKVAPEPDPVDEEKEALRAAGLAFGDELDDIISDESAAEDGEIEYYAGDELDVVFDDEVDEETEEYDTVETGKTGSEDKKSSSGIEPLPLGEMPGKGDYPQMDDDDDDIFDEDDFLNSGDYYDEDDEDGGYREPALAEEYGKQQALESFKEGLFEGDEFSDDAYDDSLDVEDDYEDNDYDDYDEDYDDDDDILSTGVVDDSLL